VDQKSQNSEQFWNDPDDSKMVQLEKEIITQLSALFASASLHRASVLNGKRHLDIFAGILLRH